VHASASVTTTAHCRCSARRCSKATLSQRAGALSSAASDVPAGGFVVASTLGRIRLSLIAIHSLTVSSSQLTTRRVVVRFDRLPARTSAVGIGGRFASRRSTACARRRSWYGRRAAGVGRSARRRRRWRRWGCGDESWFRSGASSSVSSAPIGTAVGREAMALRFGERAAEGRRVGWRRWRGRDGSGGGWVGAPSGGSVSPRSGGVCRRGHGHCGHAALHVWLWRGDLGTWGLGEGRVRRARVWRWHGGGAKGARAARCRVACVSGRVGREFVARVLPRKGSNGGLGVGESSEKGAVGGV
jgi:hypothetical protein